MVGWWRVGDGLVLDPWWAGGSSVLGWWSDRQWIGSGDRRCAGGDYLMTVANPLLVPLGSRGPTRCLVDGPFRISLTLCGWSGCLIPSRVVAVGDELA